MGTIMECCRQKSNPETKRMVSIITHYKNDHQYQANQKSNNLLFNSMNELFPCKYLGKGLFGSTIMVFVKNNKENKFAQKIILSENIMENYLFLDLQLVQRVMKDQYLKHRLVKVHAWSATNAKMIIVKDLMKRGDLFYHLSKLKSKNGRFYPENAIKRIAYEVLQMLDKMHSYGIIYRNLRSENVFITNQSKYGIAFSDYFFSINDNQCLSYYGTAEYAPPQVFDLQKNNYQKKFNKYDLGQLNELYSSKQKWLEPNKQFFGKEQETQKKVQFVIPQNLKKLCTKSIQIQKAQIKKNQTIQPVNTLLYMNISQPIEASPNANQFKVKQKISGQFQHKKGLTAHQSIQDNAYNKSIDIWMLGIMLFELIFRRTPFQKIKSAYQSLSKSRYFMSKTDDIIELESHVLHRQISHIWDQAQKGFVFNPNQKDFIQRLLNKNPYKRPSVQQLKNHQFLKDCQKQTDLLKMIYGQDIQIFLIEKDLKNKDNTSLACRTVLKRIKYSRPLNGTIPQKYMQYDLSQLSVNQV